MKKKPPRVKNKPDLTRELAKKTGLSLRLAEMYIDTILGEMKEAFSKNKRIEIRGFGAFNVKKMKAVKGKNPKTQETISIPAKKKLSFKSYF